MIKNELYIYFNDGCKVEISNTLLFICKRPLYSQFNNLRPIIKCKDFVFHFYIIIKMLSFAQGQINCKELRIIVCPEKTGGVISDLSITSAIIDRFS